MTGIRGLFAEPPGVDFSRAVARGLSDRMRGQPPEALARVTLLVNTRRMARRVELAFAETGATLLPRIGLVSDLPALLPLTEALPPAAPPLALRLSLTRLVRGLLEARPDLAPRAAAFDLAGSLHDLLEEMQEEGVDGAALEGVDVGELADHWARSRDFLTIVTRWRDHDPRATPAGVQAEALRRLLAHWRAAPPPDPVIVAGSTASRGATRALIDAVLDLPQGAAILPGLDRDMPDEAWAALTETDHHDHPQHRLAALLAQRGVERADVPRWGEAAPASPARNRLLSLALRPAPATSAWFDEGPHLEGVSEACAGVTLLEATDPGEEAAAIALGLRAAVAEGRRAALITPDRTLSRQVSAHLDRWGIVPDDSAGRPLIQSAPGRLLMHLAQARVRQLEGEDLMVLLKHPLAHSNDARTAHLKRARRLETRLLREGPCAFPDSVAIRRWAGEDGDEWTSWLADFLSLSATQPQEAPLADHVDAHLDLAQALCRGSALDGADVNTYPAGALWEGPAGREALRILHDLARHAPEADAAPIDAMEYVRVLRAVLSAEEVRDPFSPHPDVMIWGALEARVRTADLVIMGGLTEGAWPDQPAPDPWLNRKMRADLGLRLPERQVGLSAHDFQLAAAGPEIWLSRPCRDAETETVPSRWLNRVTGLLDGIGAEGRAALEAMRERGNGWRRLSAALHVPDHRHPTARAPRPAPVPPEAARPRRLSVTQVETLIRDPYAIYAGHVLKLRALPPLRQGPDARLRGSVVHDAIERFTEETKGGLPDDAASLLRRVMEAELEAQAPWPAMRRLWLGKFDRVAGDLLAAEAERRRTGAPELVEEKGEMAFPGLDFTLSAKADRMDDHGDAIRIYDYKTGPAPSPKQQEAFAKQLLLEAVMVEAGAFPSLGRRSVDRVAYLQIGSKYEEKAVMMDGDLIARTRAQFEALIRRYREGQPFIARLAAEHLTYESDFDPVARRGEWDDTQRAQRVEVGL